MDSPSSQISKAAATAALDTDHKIQQHKIDEPCRECPSSRPILEFLAQADSYGREDPVDRVDMGQYTLFLAGPYCYKLRSSARLELTETTSVKQRYLCAQMEMQLGKMFAPDLYLDLVPVQIDTNGEFLQLDIPEKENLETTPPPIGTDLSHRAPVVDWLVRLRRFDFSKSYDKKVEIFQPNFLECQRLTDLITQRHEAIKWHAQAHVWPSYLGEMLDDFAPIVRRLDREAKQTTLRACLNWAHDQLERQRPMIKQRGRRGLIGQIHGNVGLGNIIELPEGLRLVNPQVSRQGIFVREWIGDPLYDLGSLIGEFWSRGLTRQANWIFSHYCNQLLDSRALDGLGALDLYLFVRAMDQVKMLATKLGETGGLSRHTDAPCGTTSALKGYIKTARECLLQDEAVLIVIGGSRQTNRSHLARLLAPETGRMPGALYLSAHQEMLALNEAPTEADLSPSAHRQSVWRLVYRRLADKARMAMAAGYSVVLEGSFDSPSSRQNLTLLAEENGPSMRVVAFHLFDPHHGKPSVRTELEQKEFHPIDHETTSLPPHRAVDPILGSSRNERDWTDWIELDASRSVGDLLGQAMSHINPTRAPKSTGTLH